MGKVFLLVVLSFVFFLAGVQAQWISHSNHRYSGHTGYSGDTRYTTDSVQDFLSDFNAAHPQINNSIVVDNDSNWINSAIGELKYLCPDRAMKVRKTEYNPDTKRHRYTDSITLDRKEIKLIVAQLRESKAFCWSRSYFPQERLVTAEQMRSLYKKDPQQYRKTGMWYFSLPLFLRGGEILVCYNMYNCGGDCGQDELTVYEKAEGHWQKFGSIFSRKY